MKVLCELLFGEKNPKISEMGTRYSYRLLDLLCSFLVILGIISLLSLDFYFSLFSQSAAYQYFTSILKWIFRREELLCGVCFVLFSWLSLEIFWLCWLILSADLCRRFDGTNLTSDNIDPRCEGSVVNGVGRNNGVREGKPRVLSGKQHVLCSSSDRGFYFFTLLARNQWGMHIFFRCVCDCTATGHQ